MPFVKGQSGNPAGKPVGANNKATQAAREAIAAFVNDGSESFKTWLEMVANGVRETQKMPDGSVVETDKWLIRPDPEKAFQMVVAVTEYHIPKLARHEHVGDPKKPLQVIFQDKDKNL